MVLLLKLKRSLSLFFVGHAFRNETIANCLFIIKRRLPISADCSTDILSWFLPAIDAIFGNAEIGNISPFSHIIPPIPFVLPLLGITFHASTSMILQWSSSVNSNHSILDLRCVYMFNPVVLLSCLMSPAPSLLHLLLSVASYSALKGWSFLLSMCLAALVMGHFEFIVLIPAYINLLRRGINSKSEASAVQNSSSVTHLKHISIAQHCCRAAISFLVLLLCCECFNLFSYPKSKVLMDPVTNLIDRMTQFLLSNFTSILSRKKLNFEPAVNVWWYLDVQTFTQFSDYILLLTVSQPFLFFIPIMLRFSDLRPLHTVRATVCL